jgi:hypothetical protein
VSACYKLATELWGVTVHLSPDGSAIASYRAGVDAIWTGGAGFPSEEMSAERRLELGTEWTTAVEAVKDRQALRLHDLKLAAIIAPANINAHITKKQEQEREREERSATSKARKDTIAPLHKLLKKAYYKKSLQVRERSSGSGRSSCSGSSCSGSSSCCSGSSSSCSSSSSSSRCSIYPYIYPYTYPYIYQYIYPYLYPYISLYIS